MSKNCTSAVHKSTYYLGIVYTKLATKWKLHIASTYLPNLEVLCLEYVLNIHLATTISSLRLRPSSGQIYIPMSQEDS